MSWWPSDDHDDDDHGTVAHYGLMRIIMMMMMILARLPIADSINPGGDISNSPSRLRHYTRPPSPTSDKRLFI